MERGPVQQNLERWRKRAGGPRSGRAYLRVAELLVAGGRPAEALALLDENTAVGTQAVGAQILRAKALLGLDRAGEAGSILTGILGGDPQNTVALFLMVEAAGALGDWRQAAGRLEELVTLDPEDQALQARLEEARRHLAAPRQADPPAPARSTPDQPAPAQSALAQSSQAQGGTIATLTLVDIYLAQGYRRKALAALREMAAAEPGREDLRVRIAELERILADDREAPGGQSAAGGAEGPGPGGGDIAAARERSVRRRSADKEQFRTWLDRVRDDGERTS